MTKHILVIPGDGIGPEVTHWGKAALQQIAFTFNHEFYSAQLAMLNMIMIHL